MSPPRCQDHAPPPHPPSTIWAGRVCAQAGNPRGKVPRWSLEERRNAGGGRSPWPAARGGRMETLGGRMRLEPSSRSESPSSSPPPLPVPLAPRWDPLSRSDLPVQPPIPPALCLGSPSSSPLPPRRLGTHGGGGRWLDPGAGGSGAIDQPGWERGNRRVRLCLEKVPLRNYQNPDSSRPPPRRLSGDLPPPQHTLHMLGGLVGSEKAQPLGLRRGHSCQGL